jgi:hypothetical protein
LRGAAGMLGASRTSGRMLRAIGTSAGMLLRSGVLLRRCMLLLRCGVLLRRSRVRRRSGVRPAATAGGFWRSSRSECGNGENNQQYEKVRHDIHTSFPRIHRPLL